MLDRPADKNSPEYLQWIAENRTYVLLPDGWGMIQPAAGGYGFHWGFKNRDKKLVHSGWKPTVDEARLAMFDAVFPAVKAKPKLVLEWPAI